MECSSESKCCIESNPSLGEAARQRPDSLPNPAEIVPHEPADSGAPNNIEFAATMELE
jgi:hypothetical protein